MRPFNAKWTFRNGGGQLTEVAVSGDISVSPAAASRGAALMGLGIALLPNYQTDMDFPAGRLVHLLSDWDVTATSFDTRTWLVYPSRTFLPARTRAMIGFLRADLRWADLGAGAEQTRV